MQLSARMQKKQWVIQPADARAAELAESLRVSPLLAQVLINRQIADAHAGAGFLKPKLTELIAPELMPGVKIAVDRIKQAIESKEKITIYGDYDVDGITGVAILWQLLTMLGVSVDYYIPHRIDEGYGLNAGAIESLAESGTSLLITVDCGITAFDSAELAGQLGLDLIVTDHHRPEAQLPRALAIVHPAIEESYPNKASCGAMVAFKLAWAIANEFKAGAKLEPRLRDFMINATSLTAMGTIADVMELRGENRVLTSYGLKTLAQCELCGVQALIESASLTGHELDAYHIGFRLAPMLNAAGRMGHARLAVELLTSDSPVRSAQIAEYLKGQNDRRRRFERKIFKQSCEMIAQKGLDHPDRKSIVLASKDWHGGIIGIVAARIVDKYFRPAIIINIADGIAKGSGRSIAGFNLLNALDACSRHLRSFGGHEMAAGLTIETENIEQFVADFEAYTKEKLNEEDIVDKLHIDALARLGQLTQPVIKELRMLGPFGRGNPEPVFATKGVRLASTPRRVGAKSSHLQLVITDNTTSISCIGFGMGSLEKKLLECDFFNVAYRPEINTYNGNTNIQLVLTDIQFE